MYLALEGFPDIILITKIKADLEFSLNNLFIIGFNKFPKKSGIPYIIIISDKTKNGKSDGKILLFHIESEKEAAAKIDLDSVSISKHKKIKNKIIKKLIIFFIFHLNHRKDYSMLIKLYENIKNYIIENCKSFLILIIIFIIFFVHLPFYISAPGGVIDTKNKIDVSTDFKLKGSLNMAYVSSIKGNIPLLTYALISPNWDIEKESEITAGNESIEDEEYRNKLLLEEANDTALLVAYANSNIDYETKNNKVYVTYIDELSKTNFKVGDQIIKIEDNTVTKKQDLYDYIDNKEIGDKVTFTVIRNNKEKKCYAKLIDVDKTPKVGIVITEDMDIKSDRHVDIKFKGKESGSSGGLMMSLTIYSYLNKIDITKGKKIVGTGTIDKAGNIGEISGIKYKLIGAVKEKCDIFLVPQGENYIEARNLKNKKHYNIDIIPVETFKEALSYLNS